MSFVASFGAAPWTCDLDVPKRPGFPGLSATTKLDKLVVELVVDRFGGCKGFSGKPLQIK